jgi:hypothetical protein
VIIASSGKYTGYWASTSEGRDNIKSPTVDGGIPYPGGSVDAQTPKSGDPTKLNGPIGVFDKPGRPTGDNTWFLPILESLEQDFETCVVCLAGPDYRNDLVSEGFGAMRLVHDWHLTVYGCITWSHKFVRNANGTYTATISGIKTKDVGPTPEFKQAIYDDPRFEDSLPFVVPP